MEKMSGWGLAGERRSQRVGLHGARAEAGRAGGCEPEGGATGSHPPPQSGDVARARPGAPPLPQSSLAMQLSGQFTPSWISLVMQLAGQFTPSYISLVMQLSGQFTPS